MNDVAGNFGANLKRVRTEKGVKRQEIAELLGVGVDLIGLYENGKRLAPLDKIFKIADYLKVSVATLTGENGFSNAVPDIPKIIDDKIREYKFERAKEIVENAQCEISYEGEKIILNLPNEITTGKNDYLTVEPITPTKLKIEVTYDIGFVVEFKNTDDFVAAIEQVLKTALVSDETFLQSLKHRFFKRKEKK